MLTKNLDQEVGLVNGIRGDIVEIVYKEGKPAPALPLYVVVNFRRISRQKLVAAGELRWWCACCAREFHVDERNQHVQDAAAAQAVLSVNDAQVTGTYIGKGGHRLGGEGGVHRVDFCSSQ